MKRVALTGLGIVLAGLAVGAVASIFWAGSYVVGSLGAVIFGRAAFRAWAMAGEARVRP